jgi:recombination protein RecR
MSDTRERLTKAFKHFPGIGPRQGRRFVYFLLSQGPKFSNEFADQITKLHESVTRCEITNQYFPAENEDQTRSPIARDDERDWSKLLIVETDMDLEAIEDTGEFNGMYFVLGSQGSLTDENLENRLNLTDLKNIIETHYEDELEEVIVATSVTPEGERIRDTVTRFLADTAKDLGFSISTLGRGLSTGTELEYIDDNTLRHALDGRN